MSAWSNSLKCFQPTTASPAPNTWLPRASRTSSSSRRWQAAESPAWRAAFTQFPPPMPSSRPFALFRPNPHASRRLSSRGFGFSSRPHSLTSRSLTAGTIQDLYATGPPLRRPCWTRRAKPSLPAGTRRPCHCRVSCPSVKGVTLAELRQRLTGRSDARERRTVGRIVPQSQSIIECMAKELATEGRVPCGVAGQHPRESAILI